MRRYPLRVDAILDKLEWARKVKRYAQQAPRQYGRLHNPRGPPGGAKNLCN